MTLTAPAEASQYAATRGLSNIDRRYHVANIEIRGKDDDPNTVAFFGHASVTGKGYEMYGGPQEGGWTEFVDRGAFKKTLKESPDVAFLLNHGGMTLARTKSGTLSLQEDSVGLAVNAQLDARVSIVNDIRIQMERGDLDEMSFAFRVTRQQWLNDDGEEVPWWDLSGVERHITEVSLANGDVSVVNFGANPYTDAALRQAAHAGLVDPTILRRAADELDPPKADTEEPESTVPVVAAGDTVELARITAAHRDLMSELFAKRLGNF